jgi:DNA-binding CsgD family transcriptional regulator/tetratricopeptide (TPR) repeat protein
MPTVRTVHRPGTLGADVCRTGGVVSTDGASRLLGRAREFETLVSAAEAAQAGEPQVVLVSGDTGLGKTRLLREFADHEAASGALVLWGGSPPVVGTDLPLAPVSEMLRRASRRRPNLLDDAFYLRAATGLAPATGAGTTLATPQTVVFEEFLGLVARLAAEAPLLIVVFEDLHWGDASTLDLVGFLARNLRDERVLVGATYRQAQVDRQDRLRSLATELRRAGAVDLQLAALAQADMEQHVRSMVGDGVPAADIARVVGLADGNPFYAQELARAAPGGAGLPRTIRDLIAGQLAALDETALSLLRLAASAGRRTRPALMWAAAGLPDAAVGTAIDTLIGAGILTRSEGSSGEVLEIRHALVREIAYGDQLEPDRARRHHALARALATKPDLGVGGPIETTIEIAHHWQAAGDPLRAFPALVRAAEAAEGAYAFPEADRLYGAALERYEAASRTSSREPIGFRPRPDTNDEITTLKRRAAEAASLAGNPERAAELMRHLVEQVPPDQADPAHLAALGRYRYEGHDAIGALAAFEEAAGHAGPDLLPRVLVGQARALLAAGRGEAALAAAHAAVQAATASGSTTDRRAALTVRASAEIDQGSTRTALDTLEQARGIAERTDRLSVIRPRPSRVMDLVSSYADAVDVLRRAGRTDDARAAAETAARAAKRFGATSEAARLQLAEAEDAYEAGHWDQALGNASALVEAAPSTIRLQARLVRARIHVARGVWQAAVGDLQAVEDLVGADGGLLIRFARVVAELRSWRRELAKASESASDGLRAVGAGAAPVLRAELLELGVAIAAEQHVEARALRAGDPTLIAERARDLLAELSAVVGASEDDQLRALLLSATAHMSRTETSSIDRWAEAADAWQALGRPFREAIARFRLAESALERGSRDGVADELRRANALAEQLEASPLVEEIRRLATRGRVNVEPDARQPVAPVRATSALGLSEREIDVLRLIALGRTNRQIGEELFITEKTSSHHVSNILAKLDVATRVEAAGIAYRAGIVEGP